MTTKITAIYDIPLDPDAFERDYPDHLALGRKVPGVQRLESSKVWPKEDRTAPPAHRMLDLYFEDYAAAAAAVTTDEAAAWITSVFDLATGGVRIVFADVEPA